MAIEQPLIERRRVERPDVARVASGGVDEMVERVVLQINGICKNATLEFSVSVGRLVVNNFYAKDLASWRSRGTKDASFRKLARHPHLPMSPAALYRCVAIFELCERLGIRTWRHVSTSHLRLVLALPMDDQLRLLKAAEAQSWPVRRLEKEVSALAIVAPGRRRAGRKRRTPLARTLGMLEKCLDASNNLVGASEDGVALSPETVRSIVELVGRMRQACLRLEKRVAGQGRPPALVGQPASPRPTA